MKEGQGRPGRLDLMTRPGFDLRTETDRVIESVSSYLTRGGGWFGWTVQNLTIGTGSLP